MTVLESTKIQSLKESIKGEVLLPHDKAYESARQVWNAMVDKHPALIVRRITTPEVVQAVNFARDNGLPRAVARLRAAPHWLTSTPAPRPTGWPRRWASTPPPVLPV